MLSLIRHIETNVGHLQFILNVRKLFTLQDLYCIVVLLSLLMLCCCLLSVHSWYQCCWLLLFGSLVEFLELSYLHVCIMLHVLIYKENN
jgi:hypothetical protein